MNYFGAHINSELTNGYCILRKGDVVGGKYVVDSRLGRGKFSIVYKINRVSDNSPFAMKVYRHGSDNREYFDNELGIYLQLGNKSDKLLQCYDTVSHMTYDYDRKYSCIHPCLIFNLCGESLSDLIDSIDSGLPVADAKRLMRELFSGLDFLHKKNIIHTDIKTNNLNLTKKIADIQNNDDISIIITDMGSATECNKLFSLNTGTQEYLAPELIVNMKYTAAVDIWSAMCVYFELLTGDSLFVLSDTYEDSSMDVDGGDEQNKETRETYSSSGSDSDGNSAPLDTTLGAEHLALITGLIGAAPKSFTKEKEARNYYNIKGNLKNNVKPAKWTISDKLVTDYEFEKGEADDIEKFMLLGLRFNPTDRWSAEKLLSHAHLK